VTERRTTPGRLRSEPSGPGRLGSPAIRRIGALAMSVAVVALAAGVLLASTAAFADVVNRYGTAVTPWARLNASATSRSFGQPGSREGPLSSAAGGVPGPSESFGPSSSARPFRMDLYEKGDYVGEFRDTWCVQAAMQTAMNIMDTSADRTQATQSKLFSLARSLAPAPDGAAEPEGWASAMTQLGYGGYEVRTAPSIRAAMQLAAKQIRLTSRPVGLLVWRGAHAWVVSGFTATADPRASATFVVTGLYVEDVWYPRISTIWGSSNPPDTLVAATDLWIYYLPWKRPRGSYPEKNGLYVLVVPVG